MPSPRLVLLAGTIAFGAVDLGATLLRSTIPVALDGSVETIEVRSEKHPGVDDVHVLHVGDDAYVVDAEVAAAVGRGRTVRKSALSSVLTVDGKDVPLRPSRDARAMWAIVPLLALAAWIVGRRRG